MKTPLLCTFCVALTASLLHAIPRSFIGGGNFIVVPAHPVFGADLTRDVLAMENWERNEFPGPWEEEPALAGHTVKRMTANPTLFGSVPQSVHAYGEDGRLQEIAITYLDAGSFFGFKPGGEGTPAQHRAGEERRSEFRHLYGKLASDLRSRLEEGCGAGRQTILGRSSLLRTVFTDYQWEGFVIRLATRDGHSLSLHIMPETGAIRSFVQAETASLTTGQRGELLKRNVRRNEREDVLVDNIPMFTQSCTPFCGIHSLAMIGHYYGLRMRADALAAAAEFENTGSARGSRILELYHAAAEEMHMRVSVSSKFNFKRARRAVEAGMPVLVWRRVSREREAAHDRFTAKLASDSAASLPPPTGATRSSWPRRDAKGSPSHASIISGVNAALKEVTFTEPWGEHARNRRMRAEEMEATAYAVFYFQF